ncbi:efflux RND transporter periplasmic adaptor subunit [Fluviispira multicolorata]|uniref:Efflux RND transporter periplasmic adaptor subunit n=1 Tax=Fluviispira multicolorata TaxID=2654512 RepID=A0A833JCF2_9BACT|nr:efflux RND transporter periplasmic adaptor subunit [Fluviispira multicolorata]KAB8029223.1 efflux RND transporter periplasmic adaptor subunit [Fluviispira multicolorata]
MKKKSILAILIIPLSVLLFIFCTNKEKHEKATLPPSGVIPKVTDDFKNSNLVTPKKEGVENNGTTVDENTQSVSNLNKLGENSITTQADMSLQKKENHSEQNKTGIRVSGNVVSLKQGNLSFQTKGFIAQEFVNVGDKISKGQIIAILDDRNPLLQKKLQQQNVQLAKVKFEQSKRELARTDELFKKHATTPFALEQSQDSFTSAQIQLTQAETNLVLAEKAFNDTRLIAPYDGKISGKFKDIGEFVSEGMSVFSAFEDKNVEISLQINEAQMSRVKIGMEINVSVPSIDKTAILKITRIVDLISKETRMFEVRGKVNTIDINLIPGQFVEAEF